MWFDRTTRVLTYDFNTANNMNYWLYYMYQERFSISYDSNTKMSTLSVAGGSGWEIVYMPIATVSGKRYRVEFDYINPNGYSALSSSYGGIGVQALTTIANNDNLSNDLETIYLSTAQNNNTQHLNIEFTATGTNTYLAFNFGMVADGVINTVKLGNFKFVETMIHGSSITNIPDISRTGYTFDGWYTAASGGTKLTSGTALSGNNTYYAHDSQTSYTITYNLLDLMI